MRVTLFAVLAWVATARAEVTRDNHPKLAITGGHAKVACETCHDRGTDQPPSKGSTCASCHDDVHHGEFAARDCAGCHRVAGFAPSTFGPAQHATTGYALEGAHAAAPCGECHPGARPRVGWQLVAFQCLDCHDNPHGEQFAKEMTSGGCAQCHTALSWHQLKIEHASWPLTGAHARTACAACHGDRPAGAPAAAYRGIARDCEGCHDDRHAGQFRQSAPDRRCASCHATESWRIAAFDHDKTRYPLEGVHRTMACDRCHAPATLRDGTTAVRWRLGYFRCNDCHADPHRGATASMDCNTCHAATSWQLAAGAGKAFDHERTTFPLRGAHVQAACAGCHTGGKPPQTCDACHRDPHQGRMDGQCYECHTAVAWSDVATLEQHRRTRMPLTGRHALIECVACHRYRQGERAYSDTPVDCYPCHDDDYHSAATHPNHDGSEGGKPLSRQCGMCHGTIAWSPAVAAPGSVMPREQAEREHDAYFELSTGSHRALDCTSCHVDPRRARAVRCDACHDDVALRGQHPTRVSTAATGCLRCHPRGARR